MPFETPITTPTTKRKPSLLDAFQDSSVVDIAMAPLRGVEGAVRGLYGLADITFGDLLPDYEDNFLGRSKTVVGGILEGVTNFATGFIPVAGQLSKAGQAVKALSFLKNSNVLRGAVAGAITDFAFFDGHENRLSNLIQMAPSLQNPVTEYLAADQRDSELEGRLKATLEGLGIGGIVDSVIGGIKRIKTGRKLIAAGAKPEEVAVVMDAHAAKQAYANNLRGFEEDINNPLYQKTPQELESLLESNEKATTLLENKYTPDQLDGDDLYWEMKFEADSIKRAKKFVEENGNPAKMKRVFAPAVDGPPGGAALAAEIKTAEQYKATLKNLVRVADVNGQYLDLHDAFVDRLGDKFFETQMHLGVDFSNGRSSFMVTERAIMITKGTLESGGLQRTAIHELWHAVEDLLPEKSVQAIRSNYQEDLIRFLTEEPKNGIQRVAQRFPEFLEAARAGKDPSGITRKVQEALEKEFGSMTRDQHTNVWRTLYRFENIDEYIAESGVDALYNNAKNIIKDTKDPFFSTGNARALEGFHLTSGGLVKQVGAFISEWLKFIGERLGLGKKNTEKILLDWLESGDRSWNGQSKPLFNRNRTRTGSTSGPVLGPGDPRVNPRKLSASERAENNLEFVSHNLEMYNTTEGAARIIRDVEALEIQRLIDDSNNSRVGSVSRDQLDIEDLSELAELAGDPNPQKLTQRLAKQDLGDLVKINARIRVYRRLLAGTSETFYKNLEANLEGAGLDVLLALRQQWESIGAIQRNVRGLTAEQGRGLQSLQGQVDPLRFPEGRPGSAEIPPGSAEIPPGVGEIPPGTADVPVEPPGRPVEPPGETGRPTVPEDPQLGSPSKPDPSTPLSVQEELDLRGGPEKVRKDLERALVAYKEQGIKGANKLANPTRAKMTLDMMTEYFMNSILSGPRTINVNFIGAGMMSVYRPLEMLMGGKISQFIRGHDGAVVQQALREFHALRRHVRDSFEMAKIAFRESDPVLNRRQTVDSAEGGPAITAEKWAALTGMDPNSAVAKSVDWLGKVIRTPSRILTATDEFFKQLNYRASVEAELIGKYAHLGDEGVALVQQEFDEILEGGQMYSQARLYQDGLREAQTKGLQGDAAKDYAFDYARPKEEGGNFDVDFGALAARAQQNADQVTFTSPLETGPNARGLDKVGNHAMNLVKDVPILRIIMPFVRTPLNILKYGKDRNPITTVSASMGVTFKKLFPENSIVSALQTKTAKELLSADPKVAADAAGRVATGLGVTLIGMSYAASGVITGRGPSDPETRKVLEESGWLPYSIKVGDKYVQYGRLDPFATMFGFIADVYDYEKWADPSDSKADVMIWGVAQALAQNFTNKSYLTGLSNFVTLLEDPARTAETFGKRTAGAFVPSLSGQFAGQIDTMNREMLGVGDAMLNRLPLFNESLEPMRNVLGEPVKRVQGSLSSAERILNTFNPIVYRETTDDQITMELAELGHAFNPPKSTKGTLDLREIKSASGQSAYDRWMELHGEVRINGKDLRGSLKKLINSKDYKQLPAEETFGFDSPRIAEVNRIINQYRRAAYRQALKEIPELRQADIIEKDIRQQLRSGTLRIIRDAR